MRKEKAIDPKTSLEYIVYWNYRDINSSNRRKEYYKDKKGRILHRLDGPAIEYRNGNKEWWINNKLHREGSPAIESENGREEWFINGLRHRLDGPAVKWIDGSYFWYKNGKLHRENGPAFYYKDMRREWYINGKLHRLNGPAIEYDRKPIYNEYYIDDIRYSKEEYDKKVSTMLKFGDFI